MAVAETPGFAYVWSYYEWTGELGIQEIEYTLLDDVGDVNRPVSKLTNHSGTTMTTRDYNPAVAVAPNGNIGVI